MPTLRSFPFHSSPWARVRNPPSPPSSPHTRAGALVWSRRQSRPAVYSCGPVDRTRTRLHRLQVLRLFFFTSERGDEDRTGLPLPTTPTRIRESWHRELEIHSPSSVPDLTSHPVSKSRSQGPLREKGRPRRRTSTLLEPDLPV